MPKFHTRHTGCQNSTQNFRRLLWKHFFVLVFVPVGWYVHRWVGCKNSVNVTLDVRIVFSKQSVRILCVCLSLARSLSLSCSLSLSRSLCLSFRMSVCLSSIFYILVWNIVGMSVCCCFTHITERVFSTPGFFFREWGLGGTVGRDDVFVCVFVFVCTRMCTHVEKVYSFCRVCSIFFIYTYIYIHKYIYLYTYYMYVKCKKDVFRWEELETKRTTTMHICKFLCVSVYTCGVGVFLFF